jgi:hypothetical protein
LFSQYYKLHTQEEIILTDRAKTISEFTLDMIANHYQLLMTVRG